MNGRTSTLTTLGTLSRRHITDCPGRFLSVTIDDFVVMPNHVHGIIAFQAVGAQFIASPFLDANQGAINCAPTKDELWCI
jgi:hypothetical protein